MQAQSLGKASHFLAKKQSTVSRKGRKALLLVFIYQRKTHLSERGKGLSFCCRGIVKSIGGCQLGIFISLVCLQVGIQRQLFQRKTGIGSHRCKQKFQKQVRFMHDEICQLELLGSRRGIACAFRGIASKYRLHSRHEWDSLSWFLAKQIQG